MFQARPHHALVAALFTAALSLPATALAVTSTTYGFAGVPGGSLANITTGAASLSVEVIDLGSGQVGFKFTNTSSSSLTDVYFDDGTLLGIASITNSGAGVSFSQGAAPGNLPGGNNLTPGFLATAGFTADSNPAVSPNGVTAGEWVTITFNLLSGQSYASVINAMSLPNGGGTGDLRIGLHVQSFPGGGSASFVNIPTPIPEADTYALMLAGLGLVGFAARYRPA